MNCHSNKHTSFAKEKQNQQKRKLTIFRINYFGLTSPMAMITEKKNAMKMTNKRTRQKIVRKTSKSKTRFNFFCKKT
jgi:hypothetical protein